MKARNVRPRGKQGSALVLVFWCLLLLGMAVFAVVELVQLSVEHSANRELALEARALAASGVALGLDSQLLKDDPLFLQKPSPGRQFRVKIESEGARLNLNHLLLTGHRDVLAGLFTRWGLKIDEADHAADCLYDWITPGDLRSLNGAKAIDYERAGLTQKPSHQPFTSLEQAGQVMGMDRVAALKPDWQESFTLWSEGPLDMNEAPAELIAALFGLDVARVEFFTEARNGRDGIPGTLDDVPVTDAAALQASLGIDNLQMKSMLNQVSFGDATRRIESTGQAGDSQVMISVVTRLNSSPPTYLLWSEP